MHLVVRLWLVAFTTLAVAQPRPLVFVERASIPASDAAYTKFGGAPAIDGPPMPRVIRPKARNSSAMPW
jgi:hypothetical protein